MALAHLLHQDITIANPTGTRDRQGKPTFGSATAYKARVQKTNKMITTSEKERDPIDAIVFIETSNTISIGARLIYSSSNYRILSIEDVVGGNGVRHHLELLCQLWNI